MPIPAAVFQIDGITEPGVTLFGVWADASEARPLSFGVAADMSPAPVWRATFSGDTGLDDAAISQADTALQVTAEALELVLPRLRVVRQQELAVFGLAATWSNVVDEVRGMVQTGRRMVAFPAWVETFANDAPLGRTVVSWSGEQVSVWRSGVTASQQSAHRRTLDLAIHTRTTFIRMMGIVARGASVLMQASAGLGPLVALPAAWTFVQQVVREIKLQKTYR